MKTVLCELAVVLCFLSLVSLTAPSASADWTDPQNIPCFYQYPVYYVGHTNCTVGAVSTVTSTYYETGASVTMNGCLGYINAYGDLFQNILFAEATGQYDTGSSWAGLGYVWSGIDEEGYTDWQSVVYDPYSCLTLYPF
jgi:hypothetical protein